MFRRIFAMIVFGCVLAASPAAAQDQGYSVRAQRGGFSGGGPRKAWSGYRRSQSASQPDAGHWYGGYPDYENLGNFSHYTSPFDWGYGGHVNDDFTVSKDTAFGAPATSMLLAATDTATIELRVPSPQVQVMFDGQETATRGRQRTYATPALQVGENYYYNVTATWMENGRQVKRDRQVRVKAGRLAVVDFTGPLLTATDGR